MGLLTIGAFARAARLSPKALRIYDRLGLLRPVRDRVPVYDTAQLARAGLVASLWRLDMPLARIRIVCELEPADAAEIAAYWAEVEARTAACRDLAASLVERLDGPEVSLRYAASTDVGRVRADNGDSAYAGQRLLAVADGFDGRGRGKPASAAAIEALRPLDSTNDEGGPDNVTCVVADFAAA